MKRIVNGWNNLKSIKSFFKAMLKNIIYNTNNKTQ